MRNLIIFGDTPFAERLFRYISIEAKDKVIAFTQEKSYISRKEIQGIPVVPFEEIDEHFNEDFEIIIGIGYTQMNQLKKKIYKMCKEKKYKVGTYISSNAIVYSSEFGEGCFIAPGSIVGPGCKLGVCNYLESSVVLSHDNSLGNFNFLSTNVVLGEFSKIINNCFVGLHSTIRDDICITSYSLIGSSTNVLKSIEVENCVYVGNPAKLLQDKRAITTII